MTQWEYCEVWWQPAQVTLNFFNEGGANKHVLPSAQWGSVFARLGIDGWELVNALASPTGLHEYWYYFKRPRG